MKEKIISALKTKYKNLGFGEKAFDGVAEFLEKTVTEETQIDNAIGGIEPLLKAFQSDIDKRVTDAVAKAKADNEHKKEESKTQEKEQKKEEKKDDDVPSWAKGLIDRLDGYERREKQTALQSKVNAALSEKKIPKSYFEGRVSIDKEEDIETIVKKIEADYTAFRQELVNEGVIISTPAEPGGDKADAAIAKQIAERRNNPSAATNGVEAKKLI